jgi:hypothetical protein
MIALRSRPLAMRRIANRMLDRAEQGDLAAAHEVIDRSDAKAVQALDYGDVAVTQLTDSQLYEIAGRGRTDGAEPPKALPAPSKVLSS